MLTDRENDDTGAEEILVTSHGDTLVISGMPAVTARERTRYNRRFRDLMQEPAGWANMVVE